MSKLEKVKGYFECGLWDMLRVKNAVLKGWITAGEFEEITGESFAEDSV